MDDSLYPSDGELFNAFQEPEEQIEERRVEKSKAQAAKPMLEQLIQNFRSDIIDIESVDCITVDINTEPEKFLAAYREAQNLKKYIENKISYLESLLLTTKR